MSAPKSDLSLVSGRVVLDVQRRRLIVVDAILDPLRGEPRFAALLRALRLSEAS